MQLGGQVVLEGLADGGHVDGVAEPVAVEVDVAVQGVDLPAVAVPAMVVLRSSIRVPSRWPSWTSTMPVGWARTSSTAPPGLARQ